MASRFVPVKSFEEAEKLFEAGLLLVDNHEEGSGLYRTDFVNPSDPNHEWLRKVWRMRFGKPWPMYDFGVFVEDDSSEMITRTRA